MNKKARGAFGRAAVQTPSMTASLASAGRIPVNASTPRGP